MTRIALTTMALLLVSQLAEAQTELSAGVAFAGLHENHTNFESPSVGTTSSLGSTVEWSVAAGRALHRHLVIQAEFAKTGTVQRTVPPPHNPQLPPCAICSETTEDVRYRNQQFSLLVGYRARLHRFAVTALGGFGYISQSVGTTLTTTYPPATLQPTLTTKISVTGYGTTPNAGADFAFALTRHVHVVGRLRAYRLDSLASVDRGVATNLGLTARVAF